MRLINADELRDIYSSVPNGVYTTSHFITTIDECETIDAAPMAHGKWEEPESDGVVTFDKRVYAQCSVCKKKSYLGRADNYCRYCGAKMDLE